jgi:ribonucleoside-diphosphate reductase alpha chain
MAWRAKCKGVTVYRDGSRDGQVLSTGATEAAKAQRVGGAAAVAAVTESKREIGELAGQLAEAAAENDRLKKLLFDAEAENLQRRQKRSRPDLLRGTTIRKQTPLGVMFVNVTEDEKGQPFEVFINLGKAGGSAMADAEALGRLISLALRSGIPMAEIHRQLRGISSDRAVGLGPNKIMSMPDAVGLAIEEWQRAKQGVQQELLTSSVETPAVHPTMTHAPAPQTQLVPRTSGAMEQAAMFESVHSGDAFIGTCPDCGSQLEFAEGCVKCHVCGFSECG